MRARASETVRAHVQVRLCGRPPEVGEQRVLETLPVVLEQPCEAEQLVSAVVDGLGLAGTEAAAQIRVYLSGHRPR